MIVRPGLRPFDSPRDRAARLPWIVLLGLVYLVLAVWNPVRTPGPTLCLSRHAFALPCPLCGCTRGVALSLRGELTEAGITNPLSIPAALGGLVLIALWSFEYVRGEKVEFVWKRPWQAVFVVFVIAVVLTTWGYLLLHRIEDDFAESWLGRFWSLLREGGAFPLTVSNLPVVGA